MGDPDALLDAVRDKLRLIPTVVDLVGDADNIVSYADDISEGLFAAINNMETPSILVALRESDFGEVEFARFSYTIAVYLRLGGSTRFGAAFKTICSGVPTSGDGQAFINTEIHPDFEQLGLPVLRRDFDDDGIEYPNVALSFRDRTNG